MILHLWEWSIHLLLRIAGFRSVTTATPVGRVHSVVYEGAGPLPTLVVLHGISGSHGHFARVLWPLRRHYRRIVVPDLPGHGFSDMPEDWGPDAMRVGVLAALDALVPEPAVYVGNSMGGLVAFRLAQLRSERVVGLLLNSPGGAGEGWSAFPAFAARFRIVTLSDAATFVDRLHLRPPWYRSLVAPWVRQKVMAPVVQGLLSGLREQDLVTRDEVRALRMPVRLLWGVADTLLPPEHFTFWRDAMPDHAEVSTPMMGHCPYVDSPGPLAADILAFSQRLGRGPLESGAPVETRSG